MNSKIAVRFFLKNDKTRKYHSKVVGRIIVDRKKIVSNHLIIAKKDTYLISLIVYLLEI